MKCTLPILTLLLTSPALCQTVPLIPFPRTLDLLVVDSTYDGVWRLGDRSQNGDYLDGTEITPFYSDLIGSIVLTNPSCVSVSSLGTAYVGDSTIDIVMALNDLDGDGDANDPGEHWVFFDSATNQSGIIMASVQGLTSSATGEVFAAVSNVSSGGEDAILRFFDLNGDGDANDFGEATFYCQIPNGSGSLGNSLPTEVLIGPDGNLYYADNGTTGAVTKGLWKLQDLNFDGDANDPGEQSLFWVPPAAGNAFHWGLAVDWAGYFVISDHGNETIYRGRDANNDGMIDASEETLFYQTPNSTWWDVVMREDGTVLLCEDQTPDRIVALKDLNADGDALDPGEATDLYIDGGTTVDLRPRAAALMRAPLLVAYPNPIQVGQSTDLITTTPKPGDLVILAGSFASTPPSPLPPFGTTELSLSFIVTFAFATSDPAAQASVTLSVPNDPVFARTFAFQSLAGDLFRPFLSNGVVLTVTP